MTNTRMAVLPDRGVVSVTGADAGKLLQGLITNDIGQARDGAAIHAALLTPQGKILFAFFVVPTVDGLLLETERDQATALAKRLTFYKLRAAAKIEDLSQTLRVGVTWDAAAKPSPQGGRGSAVAASYCDPRHHALGRRLILTAASQVEVTATAADYHAHRIAIGVPEAGYDYPLGDTFAHEADLDLFGGVDFDKGCFVGQEVVARMQHKTVVRKRVVRVAAPGALPADHPDITVGANAAVIGRLGSVSASHGLALIRLDRVVEALDKGEPISAAGQSLIVAPEAVAAYRAAVAAKPAAAP